MPSAAEIVDAFLGMWHEPGGFAASVEHYFTEETVYENVGMTKSTGIGEALAMLANFGPVTMKVETLHQLAHGDLVLNERIDTMLAPDGSVHKVIPVMGLFRIRGGKIVEWRDYFDTAGFLAP